MLLLGIAHASFMYWRRWLIVDPTSTIELSMRMNFFDRLLSAPLSLLDRYSGQLLTRSMSDLGTIRRWLSFGIVQMLTVAVMFLVGGFFMLRSSPSLALVFVVTVPILVLSLVNFTRKYYRASHEIQQLTGDLSTRIEESVRGIRVIKALYRTDSGIFRVGGRPAGARVRQVNAGGSCCPVPGTDCGCIHGSGAGCGRFAGCGGHPEPGRDDRLLCGADNRAQPRDALDRTDVCLFEL